MTLPETSRFFKPVREGTLSQSPAKHTHHQPMDAQGHQTGFDELLVQIGRRSGQADGDSSILSSRRTSARDARVQTSDDDQIVAAIRAMRSARTGGCFPLSRETHRGFSTPRNRPPPAISTERRPARTVSTLRDTTAPARLSTKREPTDKAPSSASVPSFWSSKSAGPSRPFWAVAESSEEPTRKCAAMYF